MKCIFIIKYMNYKYKIISENKILDILKKYKYIKNII